jgi:hypothetical protein
MSEAGDYQPPEAAEQRAFPQQDLNAIHQRMNALEDKQNEYRGRYTPEYFYLNTKRRIIDQSLKGGEGLITAENIEDNLTRTLSETRNSKNENATQGVNTLRWAFLAYALPHDKELAENWMLTYALAEQFNTMQREHMQQTGQTRDDVTLDAEQSETLTWLLDQAAIPHEVLQAETHVSLAPLEQTLREATIATSERYPNDTVTKDHEKQADVTTLMEQWKQEDTNQES